MPTSRNGNPTSGSIPGSPSRAAAWIAAVRPKTLPVGVAPVMLGSAFAYRYGVFDPLPAFAALVGALFIQIGTNLANDYFDHRRGADTAERTGPVRASATGLIPPEHVFVAAIAAFLLASAVGVYLISHAGVAILIVGLASLLCGYAYTGGPYPLAYHGWGDLFVFVFFGPVAVVGTYYVQALLWPVPHGVLMGSLGLAALATSVLVVNNLRDIPTDRVAGKRTLAVRIGKRATQLEYLALLALAFYVPVAPYLQFRAAPTFMLAWISAPLSLYTAHIVWHHRLPRELNRALALTGLLTFLYAAAFSLGVVLSRG